MSPLQAFLWPVTVARGNATPHTEQDTPTSENTQKCTISIIYGNIDYKTAFIVEGMDSLKNRCETLMATFFRSLLKMLYYTTYYPNDITMKLSIL